MVGRTWRSWAAVAVLLLFGVLRMPLEQGMHRQWEHLHVQAERVDSGVREQLGQLSFVAALGGLRSLVASFLALEAYLAWENVDWDRLEELYRLITELQPRNTAYWDEGGWHLGLNASAFYRESVELAPAVREKLMRTYIAKGRAFYLDGIRHNPDDFLLCERLALFLRIRDQDPCEVAQYYARAASFAEAPAYARRFAAYALSECPGREREAYYQLANLYREDEANRVPTLLEKLGTLEKQLDIPLSQRLGPGAE
ncbi:MAG: hypothetical protein ACC661_03760 [Verrucomicrobiales bacterium]